MEMSRTELVGDRDTVVDEGESARPRRQPLTRQRIVRAALRIMDEEGLEAVTMRHIGRALGVEAMSLYNHVRDKEEILDSICEEVLSGFRVPDARDWREAARAGAREYRRLLLAHPRVITLMTGRKGPVTNADALKAYEFALGMFLDAGLTAPESVMALNALASYILGSRHVAARSHDQRPSRRRARARTAGHGSAGRGGGFPALARVPPALRRVRRRRPIRVRFDPAHRCRRGQAPA